MKTLLFKFWNRLQASFWFIPGLMVVGAMLLAQAMVALEPVLGGWLQKTLGWRLNGGAEGASAVLGTIATSMITIAGLVFSMTLVALSLAASQLGPRLLRNFMRDTATQMVLGTFVSGFLYCLLVQRTIRRADEQLFVPHTAVAVAVAFAVMGVLVLIYFIHHVSVSMQTNQVVARVADALMADIDRQYPAQPGGQGSAARASAPAHGVEPSDSTDPADADQPPHKPQPQAPDPRLLASIDRDGRAVLSQHHGYLQFIDQDELLDLACAANAVLRLTHRPGHYVVAGRPLLTVLPADAWSEELADKVNGAFAMGNQRTSGQDVEFAVEQLVEVAVRALSPGINDPFTAIACIDRLSSALSLLAQRATLVAWRHDTSAQLRLIFPVVSFGQVVDAAFNQIRQASTGNAAVSIRLLDAMAEVAPATHRPDDRAALLRQVAMVARGAQRALPELQDRRAVAEREALVRGRLAAAPPADPNRRLAAAPPPA